MPKKQVVVTPEQRERINALADYWFPNGLRRGKSATIHERTPGIHAKMQEAELLHAEVFGPRNCGSCNSRTTFKTSSVIRDLWIAANT